MVYKLFDIDRLLPISLYFNLKPMKNKGDMYKKYEESKIMSGYL